MPDDAGRLTRAYYRYQATASCVFFWPIFFVYYQDRAGLSEATVLWLQSFAVVVRALLDVPFGAAADRWSRRACLVLAALGYLVGALVLVVHPTLAVALLAETAFAAAAALKSGADSALLYDTLQDAGRLDLYARAEGRGQAVVSLASGATAIAGGLLAAVDLRLPYVATMVAAAASARFASTLADDGRLRGSRDGAALLLRDAARLTRAGAVRWLLALAAVAVTASHVYFYVQQPYLRAIGVPVAGFGIVFAATKVVTAVVSTRAYRVDERLGPRGAALVMATAPAVGFWLMSIVTGPVGALLILSRGALDGLWPPLLNVYMNRLVPSRLRATMLSVQSLAARLALAGGLALLGVGVVRVGLPATLAAAALGVALAGGMLVVAAPASVREPA